jgi:ATPase subunit of ABC transporter with duplicated ATPase domains
MAPPAFIYVMKDLRKVVPPSREILRGIWLSFYYGAKIGVLGPNGAGKSSLLRIMAGVDQDYQGEAWSAEGTRIGFLPQEPQLDPTLDVKGNVELAVKAQRALLQEFQDISMAFAEPMGDSQSGHRHRSDLDDGHSWNGDEVQDQPRDADAGERALDAS